MEKIITSRSSSLLSDLKETWKNRELLYYLSLRDIKVRYKQTIAGFVWLLIQPVLTVIIFTFIFGQITNIQLTNIPYPVFVFTGLIFWNLFSRSIITASESIVSNQNLVKKVFFPRIILPFSSIGIHIVDFIFSLLILIVLMFIFKYRPNVYGFALLPFAFLLNIMTALGVGCFFASINVKYRDIRLLLPFLIQLLFFLSPVIYPLSSIKADYRTVLLLNPFAGVVEAFKSVLFNSGNLDVGGLIFSTFFSFVIFVAGIFIFQKNQKYFADIV